MRKYYFLPAILFISLHSLGQTIPPGSIPINQGDSFSVRTTVTHVGKAAVVGNILRVVGVGALAYQADRIAKKGDLKAGGSQVNGNYWVPPVGAGLIVFGGDIASMKKTSKQYIGYILYNKKGVPVQSNFVGLNQKTIRKYDGIVLTGKASDNGYIRIESGQNDFDRVNNPNYVLDIVPGSGEQFDLSPVVPAVIAIRPADISTLLPGDRIRPDNAAIPIEAGTNKAISKTTGVANGKLSPAAKTILVHPAVSNGATAMAPSRHSKQSPPGLSQFPWRLAMSPAMAKPTSSWPIFSTM